jgi:hypothetical protein
LAAQGFTNDGANQDYNGQAYYASYNPINSDGSLSANWSAYAPGGQIINLIGGTKTRTGLKVAESQGSARHKRV